MMSEHDEFVLVILRHLVKIAAGRFELTDDLILNEKDEALQEILMGLLHLQEEIAFKQEELSRATALAKEREFKYRRILNTSPVTILEIDLGAHEVDGIFQLIEFLGTKASITGINKSGLSLFGATDEDYFILHSKELVKITTEHEAPTQSDPMSQSQIWETEATLTSPTGSSVPVLIRGTPFSRDAAQSAAIVTIADISELKRLESQFHQSQKMESIGRLAGGVAHDFNNLLTVINGYSDMLRSDEQDSKRLEKLDIISATGSRAAELTKQLLAFSRQEIVKPCILDINQVVADMERMLHRLIGEDVQLFFRSGTNVAQLKMDKGQLEQIVLNLVVNARDAMPKGGKITIETTNQQLHESQIRTHFDSTGGNFVMLSVSDTGSGMSKEVQQKIFEPFFTTKGAGKGTGLGLSTVHGIVKQNKGNIWVYSEPGEGTTFQVFLPCQEANAREETESEVAVPLAKGNETILLVEDEQTVRKITAETLRSNGHKVIAAENGAHAIKLLAESNNHIDLILTDVVMPNMSGRELVDTIKKTNANIRSLFMSGYTANAIVNHGVLDEGVAFLHKPFLPNQLLRAVRQVLDDQSSDER